MTMAINRCSINDLASYDAGLEFSQTTTPSLSAPPQSSSFKIADKVEPWFGLFMRSPETILLRASEIAKPVAWGLVGGALVYAGEVVILVSGVVGMILGPAVLLKSPEPPALDFRLSLLRQRLGKTENDALTQQMMTHPEKNRILENILNAKVEAQPGLIRIFLKPGEMSPKVEFVLEDETRPGDKTDRTVAAAQEVDDTAKNGTCPVDMVYVPEGTYEGAKYPAICFDEHEYTDPGSRMPRGNVNWHEASTLCEAQGKRLPSVLEWERVASQNGTKEYSTRSGELDEGVYWHWNGLGDASGPREVCLTRGRYIEYNGKEICDMCGNQEEWAADTRSGGIVMGGSWLSHTWMTLRAVASENLRFSISIGYVGFRCVSSPQN